MPPKPNILSPWPFLKDISFLCVPKYHQVVEDIRFRGDKVLIPKLGSVRITVEGEEYYITKEQDIYAKFASEEPKVNVLDVLKETVVDKDFEKYNNKVL